MKVPDISRINNRVAALAFLFKNYIRPLGLKKFGLPCLLTGTGMGIPWKLVKKVKDLVQAFQTVHYTFDRAEYPSLEDLIKSLF